MRAILILSSGLLCACFDGRPHSAPWYAHAIGLDVAVDQARYDADGNVHLLSVDGEGTMRVGTVNDDDRSLEWGPAIAFIEDGTPYDPYANDPSLPLTRYDMALRPGSDDIWVFLDGRAGPLSDDGTVDVFINMSGQFQARSGSITFEDEDTLLIAQNAVAPRLQRVDLSTGDVEPIESQALGNFTPCSMDMGGDLLFYRLCDDEFIRRLDLQTNTWVMDAPSDDDVVLHPPAMAGVAQDWILGRGIDIATCMGEASEDGRAISSTKRFVSEGTCYGMDAGLPTFAGGDVREDGDQFFVWYRSGVSLVYDRNAPPTRERDIAGTWCNGLGQFTLSEDGTFIPSGGTSDAQLWNTLQWSHNGEVLTIDYKDMSPANFAWDGNVSIKHWAVRSGDTLHMKSYTHEKFGTDGAGLSSFGGLWQPCP